MTEQPILSIKIDMDDYLEVCKKCWEEGVHEMSFSEYTYLSETQNMTNEEIVQKYIPEEKERQWNQDQEDYEEYLRIQVEVPF